MSLYYDASVNNAMKAYDIVIVGAGVVGTCCAGLLAQAASQSAGGQKLRIAVLEGRSLTPDWSEPFDPRVSAITLASQRIFDSIGAWQPMRRQRVSPTGPARYCPRY